MAMMPDPNIPVEKRPIPPQSNIYTALVFVALMVVTAATVYVMVTSVRLYDGPFPGQEAKQFQSEMQSLQNSVVGK